jgi:AraC family transcriptional regulator of adaptative response / DNA-3-methyladenine glycosylase II
MKLDTDICYQALLAHDVRFDGVFYVGVATTGIYCRTVCPAKTPKQENCTFYPSAAAAERAGYRPCLRCRPELAPGNARIDSAGRLAAAAANRIEDGELTEKSMAELAADIGITDRHLRRVIRDEFGVSPIELAQTQRLLLAKRLLTDTNLPITEVAFAAGFSSLRRFNAQFKERYRLNPTNLRKGRGKREKGKDESHVDSIIEGTGSASEHSHFSLFPLPSSLVCDLAYRPPLAWDHLIRFLVGRASCGVEAMEGERYLRTVRSGKHRGWITVAPAPGRNALRVELSAALAPALLPVLARVKRLFDLAAEPQQIAERLGPLAEPRPGLRVPGAYDGFEMAVRAILGQQITVKAATTLAGRFSAAFGEPIITPYAQLTHLSPAAERVASADVTEIIALGIITARANSIQALARAVAEGRVSLEPGVAVETTMSRLQELPGIGEWTAQYIAMRALGWPDAFPHTDLGIYKALGETKPKRILEIAEGWRPWRSYAAMHLWKSLETNE